ncbi:MAG: nucleotide sugar dehydrogenase [Candidatus Moranbacteria bacterium]|nr:nucleotide sugar dehydrogenase [Candidatus Moranbacteria bacterium]
MKISIIGSGYVGLVTGACLAQIGHLVYCLDKDRKKIQKLQKGQIPIYEPGLEKLVNHNIKAGKLYFSNKIKKPIQDSQAVFIAVGTPSSRRGDGYADLSYVYEVAKQISGLLQNYKVVVNKSTVPIGTAQEVKRIIGQYNPKANFDVASNPEFLKEGAAVNDFLEPDRVVIGTNSQRAEKILTQIYQPLINIQKVPRQSLIFFTDIASAELIKYASNSFLATKISFINEIAALCEKVSADIVDVSVGMGMDKRISKYFLKPGPGYGGSCFPKDVTALLRIAQENESPLRILEAVAEVNIAQKARSIKKIKQILKNREAGKKVLVLGLTFKPDTDDMRQAPSLSIIPALVEKGVQIYAHDPRGIPEAKKLLPKQVKYLQFNEILKTIPQVDAVVLLTEWKQYQKLDFTKITKHIKKTPFLDFRNLFSKQIMQKHGFKYQGLGRNK